MLFCKMKVESILWTCWDVQSCDVQYNKVLQVNISFFLKQIVFQSLRSTFFATTFSCEWARKFCEKPFHRIFCKICHGWSNLIVPMQTMLLTFSKLHSSVHTWCGRTIKKSLIDLTIKGETGSQSHERSCQKFFHGHMVLVRSLVDRHLIFWR